MYLLCRPRRDSQRFRTLSSCVLKRLQAQGEAGMDGWSASHSKYRKQEALGRPAVHRGGDEKNHGSQDQGEDLVVAIRQKTLDPRSFQNQSVPWLRHIGKIGGPNLNETDIRGSATLTLTVRPAKV
jgi:hypothetical protein